MRCINEQCNKEVGDVQYCPYCGTKQKRQKYFCVYCGTEMDENAIVCGNCGQKSFLAQAKELVQEKQGEQSGKNMDLISEAQAMYTDLMQDLIPDIINGNEKLDIHLYFVKKIARDSGWNDEEVGTNLNEFLSMYNILKQEHPDNDFSKSEMLLLSFQANKAHIDLPVLNKIL